MFKRFILCLLVLILSILKVNSLNAQDKKNDFSVGVNFGYSLLSMNDINESIRFFNAAGFNLNEVNGGLLFNGNIRYKITNIFSLSLIVRYAFANSKGTGKIIITGESSDSLGVLSIEENFSISVIPISLCMFYTKKFRNIDFNLGGGLGYYFGKITEKGKLESNDTYLFKNETKGGNLEFQFIINPEYMFSSQFSIDCEIGYRFAKVDNLKRDNISTGDSTLDFSGMFFNGGIRFYLF